MIDTVKNPNFSQNCFFCGNRFRVGTVISWVGGDGRTIYLHPACAAEFGYKIILDHAAYVEGVMNYAEGILKANPGGINPPNPGTEAASVKA